MMVATLVAVIVALFWMCPGNALYFHIGETEKKCFIEEIPDETMVIGKLSCCGLLASEANCTARDQPVPAKPRMSQQADRLEVKEADGSLHFECLLVWRLVISVGLPHYVISSWHF